MNEATLRDHVETTIVALISKGTRVFYPETFLVDSIPQGKLADYGQALDWMIQVKKLVRHATLYCDSGHELWRGLDQGAPHHSMLTCFECEEEDEDATPFHTRYYYSPHPEWEKVLEAKATGLVPTVERGHGHWPRCQAVNKGHNTYAGYRDGQCHNLATKGTNACYIETHRKQLGVPSKKAIDAAEAFLDMGEEFKRAMAMLHKNTKAVAALEVALEKLNAYVAEQKTANH